MAGSLLAQTVWSIIVAVSLLTASAVLLWLALGRPDIRSDSPRLTPRDTYSGMRISFGLVAGLGAVVALVVAYRRQRYLEAQHTIAAKAERREDGKLYTERFRSAAEQLGSAQAAVRLAGVYAMLNLADDWPTGRQMCVDVLCGYLRMPFEIDPRDEEVQPVHDEERPAQHPVAPPQPTNPLSPEGRQELQVRLAIQRTLAAHLRDPHRTVNQRDEVLTYWTELRFDFFGATLCNFDFAGCDAAGADFRRARFVGPTNFQNARVVGEARFTSATFHGPARFTGAYFFSEADFSSSTFDSDARFNSVHFDTKSDFSRSVFNGPVSFNATMFGSKAWFAGATFHSGAYFSDCTTREGHHFGGARANLPDLSVWPAGITVEHGQVHTTGGKAGTPSAGSTE